MMLSRFTLAQLLGAIAVLALVLALAQSEGCGTAYTTIHSLAFSPDGKRLAVVKLNWRDANVTMKAYRADLTRTISLIDVEAMTPSGVIEREFRPGNQGPAWQFLRIGRNSLSFNTDSDSLFTLEFGGGKIRRFDLNSGKVTTFFDPGPQSEVQNFALSQDRTGFAASTWNGMCLIDASSAKQIASNSSLRPLSHHGPGMGMSSDSRWVAILDQHQLDLLDAAAGLRAGVSFSCTGAFAFGPRADQLAVANMNNLSLCNLATHDVRNLVCNGEISNLVFAEEKRIVVAMEGDVVLFNVDTGQEVMQFGHHHWVTALACSPGGDIVAIGDNRGNVILWNVNNGKASVLQVPGRSGHPWTLPAGLLVLLFYFYGRAWKRRLRASNGSSEARPPLAMPPVQAFDG